MTTSPYMQFYISDYLADTSHLSTMEHGAYLLLLFAYWQRGKALPSSSIRLARIARMSTNEWNEIEDVISEFFVEEDGFWHHKRLENDLQAYAEKQGKARKAGKASAKARDKKASSTTVQQPLNERSTDVEQKANQSESESDTDIDNSLRSLSPDTVPVTGQKIVDVDEIHTGKPEQASTATASQPPSPPETTPDPEIGSMASSDPPRKPATYPPDFERFWNAYPKERRKEKPKAFTAWKVAVKLAEAEQIVRSVASYATCREAVEGFAPYPAKWLKNQRWEEDHHHVSGTTRQQPRTANGHQHYANKADRFSAATQRVIDDIEAGIL